MNSVELFHVEDDSGNFLAYSDGAPYAKCLQAAEHHARRLGTEVFITQYDGTEQISCYTITPDEE